MPFYINNFTPNYQIALQIILLLFFALIFNYLIKKILLQLQKKFERRNKLWSLSFVSTFYKPLSTLIWFIAILFALNALHFSFYHSNIPAIKTIASIACVLALGWFLIRWNRSIMENLTHWNQNKKINLTPGKIDVIRKIITIFIIFVILLLLMDATGTSAQALLTIGGVGGLVLAFASQQFISNIFGGITIYTTQPFTIGESIELPDKKISGSVEEIGWYMTKIRDKEKRPVYVPNSIFNQSIVITPSRSPYQRIQIIFGLRYEDMASIEQILVNIKNMLKRHPEINQALDIEVHLTEFSSALKIEIDCFTSKKDYKITKQDILLGISEIVAHNNAQIVHIEEK